MSEWYDITKEEISIDKDEVNVLVGENYGGAIWITIKLEDLLKVLQENGYTIISPKVSTGNKKAK